MRLPFGLGRRSSSGDGAASGGSGAETGVAGASTTSPGSSRAWASLPPIQRTTGTMPLVAEPDHFVEGLPGSRGLPPIVQQLGHEVSSLATPGLVVARVRPVESASTSAIPAPVQRRAARGASGTSTTSEWSPPAEPAPATAVSTSAAPAASRAAEAFEAAEPSAPGVAPEAPMPAPVRSMPTVSRLSVRMPDRPLTSAAMAARPAAVQRAEAAAAAAAAATGDLPRPASGSGMRRVPSPTAASMPVVSRQAAATHADVSHTDPVPAAPAATPVAAAIPALAAAAAAPTPPAPPARLGLGEPLLALPASARPVGSAAPGPVVSRSTTSGPMPLAASGLLPTAQRTSASPEGTTTLAAGSGSTPSASALSSAMRPATRAASALQRMPDLPHLPVARATAAHAAANVASEPAPSSSSPASASDQHPGSTSTASGTGAGGGAAATSAASAPTPVVQTQAAPEIRPIAGANPIRPSFVLQRSPAEGDDQDETADEAGLPSPWWAPAAEPRAGTQAFAGPGGDGGSPSIQRLASWDGPTASGGARSASPSVGSSSAPSLARYAAAVQTSRAAATAAVQRSAGPANRALPPARGWVPEAGARTAAATAVAASAPATTNAAAAPSPFGVVSGPVVQTSPMASHSAPGAAPTVQRIDPPASSTPVGPAGGAAGGASAGRGHSERDLDELAQALFSRIRGRLRSDLIHDREAKGLTFDNV